MFSLKEYSSHGIVLLIMEVMLMELSPVSN